MFGVAFALRLSSPLPFGVQRSAFGVGRSAFFLYSFNLLTPTTSELSEVERSNDLTIQRLNVRLRVGIAPNERLTDKNGV